MQFKTGFRVFAFILALTACTAGTSRASLTIDTTPSWDGSYSVATFGSPHTSTYGEVVTALGPTLESFTFYMNQASFPFAAYVYRWDGMKAASAPLWLSGPTQTSNSGVFQPITFTPGISVTPGSQYVLFASVSDPSFYGKGGDGSWGFIDGNGGNPGTYFVFSNNGNDFSALTSSQWDSLLWFGTDRALAFKAEFTASPVPIPGALLLFGPALAGLIALRRRFVQ